MRVVIAFLQFFLVPCLTKTALEKKCETLPKAFYHGHSCFQESWAPSFYNTACNRMNNGHLVFILTNKMFTAIVDKIKIGLFVTTASKYIGLDHDRTAELGQQWAWIHPDGRKWIVPETQMILWRSGYPGNSISGDRAGVIGGSTPGMVHGYTSNGRYYICQYEEPQIRVYTIYMNNKKGHNSTIIKEINDSSFNKCARSSSKELVSSSFAYNENTRHCIVQWTDGRISGYEPVDAPEYQFWHLNY